jgi:hypothetical protein
LPRVAIRPAEAAVYGQNVCDSGSQGVDAEVNVRFPPIGVFLRIAKRFGVVGNIPGQSIAHRHQVLTLLPRLANSGEIEVESRGLRAGESPAKAFGVSQDFVVPGRLGLERRLGSTASDTAEEILIRQPRVGKERHGLGIARSRAR